MMKKLILLTIAGAVTLGVNAQQSGNNSVVLKAYKPEIQKMQPVDIGTRYIGTNTGSAKKGTATGGNRWYNQFDQEHQGGYTDGSLSSGRFVFPIGWDSFQHQIFTQSGKVPVNWLATAQFIDPIYSYGFNQNGAGFYTDAEIKINAATPYTVDSVEFSAAYMIGVNGNIGTIDTLYLSVAPVPYDDITINSGSDPDVTKYKGVPEHNNELKSQRLNTVDTLTHQFTFPGTVSWKIPLADTLRKAQTTTGYPTAGYRLEVPGGLNVPAGQGFAISLAFKPGQSWAPGDTVQNIHYWMPLVAQAADGAQMPYFYYEYEDRNMSYLMHNEGPNRFGSSINLELANTIDFSYEFLRMGAHVVCNTCWDLGINNSNTTINKFNAYPNPAVNELTVSYNLHKTADVTISIANAIGQTVATKSVANTANGNVEFSVADFANGVYFYTVTADGQSFTRRFVVSH